MFPCVLYLEHGSPQATYFKVKTVEVVCSFDQITMMKYRAVLFCKVAHVKDGKIHFSLSHLAPPHISLKALIELS